MELAREQRESPLPPPSRPPSAAADAAPTPPPRKAGAHPRHDDRHPGGDIDKLSFGLLSRRDKRIEDLLKDMDVKSGFRQVANDCMTYINFLNGVLHPCSEGVKIPPINSKLTKKISKESIRKTNAEKASKAFTPKVERVSTAQKRGKEAKKSVSQQIIVAEKPETPENICGKNSEEFNTPDETKFTKKGLRCKRSMNKSILSAKNYSFDYKNRNENTSRLGKDVTSINKLGGRVKENKKITSTSQRLRAQLMTSENEHTSDEEEDPEQYVLYPNNESENDFDMNNFRDQSDTTDKVSIQNKRLNKIDTGIRSSKEKRGRKPVTSTNEISSSETESKSREVTSNDKKLKVSPKRGTERDRYFPSDSRADISSKQNVLQDSKNISSKSFLKESRVKRGKTVLPHGNERMKGEKQDSNLSALCALLDVQASGDGPVFRKAVDPVPSGTPSLLSVDSWNDSGSNSRFARIPSAQIHETSTPRTPRGPTSSRPISTRPTSSRPTSTCPTSTRPTSTRPTSARPTSTRPTSACPTSIRPTSIRPKSSRPTSIRPKSIRPKSTRPTSARPTSACPTSTRPTSIRPKSSRPTSIRPKSTRPTSARPTSARPTSTRPTPTRSTPTRSIPTRSTKTRTDLPRSSPPYSAPNDSVSPRSVASPAVHSATTRATPSRSTPKSRSATISCPKIIPERATTRSSAVRSSTSQSVATRSAVVRTKRMAPRDGLLRPAKLSSGARSTPQSASTPLSATRPVPSIIRRAAVNFAPASSSKMAAEKEGKLV